MWDERDYVSRWVQGIFAVVLLCGGIVGLYLDFESPTAVYRDSCFAAVCLWLCWRCARYAITGRNNVNRDF